jgi:hypothetical protein
MTAYTYTATPGDIVVELRQIRVQRERQFARWIEQGTRTPEDAARSLVRLDAAIDYVMEAMKLGGSTLNRDREHTVEVATASPA